METLKVESSLSALADANCASAEKSPVYDSS
jgi:hypothetical protein